MSQHDLDIANQTFPNTRSDLNNALKALGSTSSGATVPSTTYANQLWYDTANNKLYIRNEDNDANIEICELDQTNDSVEFFKADSIRTALVEYTDGTDAFTISSDGTVAFDTNTLYVDATNNKVGIGTSSPSSPLEVVGGAPLASGFTQSRSGHPTFGITNGGTDSVYFHLAPSGGSHQTFMQVRDDDTDVDSIAFSTSGTEAMRIDSSGNVGIGTSSPAINLETSGSMAVSDTSTATKRLQLDSGASAHTINSANYGSDMMDLSIQAENLIFKTGLVGVSERMRINSSGQLSVGSTNVVANSTFTHNGDSEIAIGCQNTAGGTASQISIRFMRNTSTDVGSITTTNIGTQFNVSSDYRLKENIDYSWDATTRLKQLKPARFNFKIDTDTTVDGFIAHEVSSIVPEAVTGEKDAMKVQNVYDDDGNVTGTETVPDYQGIDQSKLVPLLVKTCQEQQTIIEDLQTRITALENN